MHGRSTIQPSATRPPNRPMGARFVVDVKLKMLHASTHQQRFPTLTNFGTVADTSLELLYHFHSKTHPPLADHALNDLASISHLKRIARPSFKLAGHTGSSRSHLAYKPGPVCA